MIVEPVPHERNPTTIPFYLKFNCPIIDRNVCLRIDEGTKVTVNQLIQAAQYLRMCDSDEPWPAGTHLKIESCGNKQDDRVKVLRLSFWNPCTVLLFFISRSPFRCASSASIIGSVSHPVGDRPCIHLRNGLSECGARIHDTAKSVPGF